MKLKLEIDDSKWAPETKNEFKRAVKMMAYELAKSINADLRKYQKITVGNG